MLYETDSSGVFFFIGSSYVVVHFYQRFASRQRL